jgi:hypothetical protein
VSRAYLKLEPDTVRFGHIEELDKLAPNAVDLLDFVLRACPELNAVDLGAQANDCAAYLVAFVQLLTDERHGEPLPTLVEQRRVVFHREHPLATIRVRLVLPHRLDARLEQVVVGVALQLRRGFEPVEVPAIRLDRIELADGREARFVGTRVGGGRVRGIRGGHRRVRQL